MKYLITGGAGFIGSHLAEDLVNQGHSVIIFDDLSSGYVENLIDCELINFNKVKVQDINITDVKGLNGIFHLAAQASVPVSIDNFYESSSNNLLSSLKVFEVAREFQIPVVYASSSAIYGNLPIGDDEYPNYEILSPYALDKLTLEYYSKVFFKLYQICSIGLRFFNVYGPKQDPTNPYSGVISVFIDRFLKKLPIQINGGYQTRDFIYVKDVTNTIIKSMEYLHKNCICEFINVGTGISITIENLFNELIEICNYTPGKIYKPLLKGDPEKSSGTYNKLEHILSIDLKKFVTFKEGLANTYGYFKGKINEKI